MYQGLSAITINITQIFVIGICTVATWAGFAKEILQSREGAAESHVTDLCRILK